MDKFLKEMFSSAGELENFRKIAPDKYEAYFQYAPYGECYGILGGKVKARVNRGNVEFQLLRDEDGEMTLLEEIHSLYCE